MDGFTPRGVWAVQTLVDGLLNKLRKDDMKLMGVREVGRAWEEVVEELG